MGGALVAQALVWGFSAILNAHGQTRLTMTNSLAIESGQCLLSLYLVTHTDYGVAGVAVAWCCHVWLAPEPLPDGALVSAYSLTWHPAGVAPPRSGVP